MSAPLLATKLFIPPPGKYLVNRSRLVTKLDECLRPGCRLTLISAPPGFGKTTLISTWVARLRSAEPQRSSHIAWLSLDDGDNDRVIFWTYLISALQTGQAETGQQALNLLQAASSPNLDGVLTSLINNLAELSTPFILILDDYHFIRSAEIHKSLSFFLEHMPPQFHVLTLSRTDPPLPLALLRGRGQLLEIRLADLRFSNDEAMIYLNEGLKLALPPAAVEVLNTKTEGWVAGLQMAGLSMQGRPDTSQFVQTFNGSNRHILDYLTDEILDRQPAEVRTFLLRTSVLEQLSAPLCEAVIDQPGDTQVLLGQLEKANLFLVPLDSERHWFRYHHLFADLLRAKLAQSDPKLAPTLRRRAAEWFEKNGLLAEAVFYAHAAKDVDGLVRLIEQNTQPMIRKGRVTILRDWVQLLPEDTVIERPWLCILSAWVHVARAEIEKAIPLLDRAEALIRQARASNGQIREMLGTIFTLRTEILEARGDIPGTIEMARQALELLDPANVANRASVNYSLGRAYYSSGDLFHADQVWSEFVRMSIKAGIYGIYAVTIGIRSTILAIQGKLRAAMEIYRQALDHMAANDIDRFFLSGNPYQGYGLMLYQGNDLAGAEKFIDEGIRHNQPWGNLNATSVGLSYRAQVRIATGNLEGAWDDLREVERINQGYTPYFDVRGIFLACRAKFFLAKGDVVAAARLVKESGLSHDDPLSFQREQDHITLSRVLIAQGDLAEAEGLLSRLAEAAQASGRFGRLIEILGLRAIALRALGRASDATQALQASLTLAEPEGYIRVFVDEGAPMARLLEAALQEGMYPEYARQLLAAFPGFPPLQPSTLEIGTHNPALIEPLSRRELEVLQLIAAELTNKEIAHQLCISVRTVKYHTTSIYTKLEVDGRASATTRARELGLLK